MEDTEKNKMDETNYLRDFMLTAVGPILLILIGIFILYICDLKPKWKMLYKYKEKKLEPIK